MKSLCAFIMIMFIVISEGCEMTRYLPDNQISGLPTRVLLHRGNGRNTDFIENTLPAAQYGLSVMDGIEVDIQMNRRNFVDKS